MPSRWRNRTFGPRSFLLETQGRLSNAWMDMHQMFVSRSIASEAGKARTSGTHPSKQVVEEIRHQLSRILTDNIIPFWYPTSVDEEYGGYRLNHDIGGRWMGAAPKGVVSQARTLWFFSRLARSEFGTSEHHAAATHGFNFLKDRLWDDQFGGFYWEMDPTGRVAIAPRKHLFGQAAALYALCEYVRASENSAAQVLCRELFDLLQQHAYDALYGGYREFMDRDWQDSPVHTPNYLGAGLPADVKTANTHAHLMEATTAYYALTRDSTARDRLLNLIIINSNAVVRKTKGTTSPAYDRDWTPLRGGSYDYVFYGYQLKNVWLTVHACREAGLPAGPLVDLYRTLVRNATDYAMDRRNGGFYEAGRRRVPASKRDKIWWVQAEALMCLLHMYSLTRDPDYFTCYQRTLDWVLTGQIDWRNGEWYARVRNDVPAGDKADRWKDPYHHGRAMIEGLAILEGIGGE
jgi:mannose/cellobiose epimerase-like protein (N-acyl-D-glucosamine 2-epimerase family)